MKNKYNFNGSSVMKAIISIISYAILIKSGNYNLSTILFVLPFLQGCIEENIFMKNNSENVETKNNVAFKLNTYSIIVSSIATSLAGIALFCNINILGLISAIISGIVPIIKVIKAVIDYNIFMKK